MEDYTIQQLVELAEQNAARSVSYMDISNLFAEHIHYLRGNQEAEDFDAFWSRREDICYLINAEGYSGREAVKSYLVTAREQRREARLPMLAKTLAVCGVEETSAYLGYGDHEFHSLINPYIQVAGDNQTAKGIWWAPGIEGAYDADGGYPLYFTALIYMADFIREEDGWKIWHLREAEEFSFRTQHFRIGLPDPRGIIDRSGMGVGGPGMTTIPTKEQVVEAIKSGKKIGGRVGENLCSYYGLPQASPPHQKEPEGFVDAGQLNVVNGVCRLVADVIRPYETWDDSIGVMRTYLKYFPEYDKQLAEERMAAQKQAADS